MRRKYKRIIYAGRPDLQRISPVAEAMLVIDLHSSTSHFHEVYRTELIKVFGVMRVVIRVLSTCNAMVHIHVLDIAKTWPLGAKLGGKAVPTVLQL